MYIIDNKLTCTGCTACMHSCPINAIIMESDKEGFLYPKINYEICISCKKCEMICSQKNTKIKNTQPEKVYAVRHKDENIRLNSSSGAAFTALSDYILSIGGVIYGVMYNESLEVVHCRATDTKTRNLFRGSKYVQSRLDDTFYKVKHDLLNKIPVLFTGTGCQIQGLKDYLELSFSDLNDLFLCEILCHSGPSPLIWNEHLNLLQSKHKSKLVNYKHKSKIAGWHKHIEQAFFENGKYDYKSILSQNFKELFYSNLINRPCCDKCIFTGLNKVGDITIGDFWGIEKFHPEFDDNKGVSMILINTSQGNYLFNNSKNYLNIIESTYTEAFYMNHSKPSKAGPKRALFWASYEKYGYMYVLKKFNSNNIGGFIKRKGRHIYQPFYEKMKKYLKK